MFNAGVRGKRAKDSTGLLTVGEHFNQQQYLIPTVTRFAVTDGSYVDTNDTAADTAGNQTIVVYGSGFAPGATIIVGSTTISVVTFLDSGRLAFTSPALGSGSYTIFVTNANGGTGILVPGLVYSGVPTFTTAAGSLGTIYETTAINTTVVATGDAPITYALSSGSLPSGSTLSSGGTISGTAPVDGSSTTYSFTIQATDAQFQDSVRSFTLTITTDVVSFSSPANNTTTTITQNSAISNVTVVATSAAGYGVLYTSSGLPTGLSMNTSTGIISGTPTVAPASNVSIITATANTTNRTATRYLNWTVNLPGDLFWKYAALLMTANTVSTGNTFNTDLSTFNNEVVVVGDTKPNGFNPFKEGYYSNYFDGSGDFLTTAATPVFANLWFGPNVTVECWVYFNSVSNTPHIWSFSESTSVRVTLYVATSVLKLYVVVSTGGDIITSPTTLITNRWYHVVITRNSSTWTMWLDGVSQGTSTSTSRPYGVNEMLAIGTQNYTPGAGDYLNGYISNFRAVSNTALYTAAFTPPTAPLTYTANTVLLTCQSNKLIDNSNNNITITKNGDTTINSFSPFNGTPTSVTVPGTNNYSLYFDGTGDYLSGPINYPFITTGPFTIEFWVYQPSLALKALISNARWNIGQNGGFRVNLSASGAVVLDASTGTYNTYPNVFTTTSTITASTWTHIAIVRNSSNSISCYINGVLARTPVTYASSLSLSSDGNIGQFIVGAGIYDGGAADLFNGYMSNIRIINDALYTGNFTPSNSPLALTQSSSANTAAITALPTNGGSVYFDGSSDYLTVPSNTWTTLAGQFTIEFWVNFASAPTSNPFIGVGSTGGFNIYNDGTRISPNLFGTGNIFNSTFTTAGIVIGRWYHIAVTRDSSNLMTMWADGVSVGSATTSTTYTQGTWQIGNSNFRCHISNLRIANTCLYTSTFTPSTTPLTAVANTILLTCQSSSASNNRIILDNGNNAYTITSVGDTIAKSFSPFANTPSILMAQANTVIDSSNNGITFTVAGDARPTRNGPFANTTTVTLIGNEGSTYFDGSGDYLSMSAIGNPLDWPASANYTIEAWVYLNAFTATESSCILARRNPTTTTTDWQFQISTTGALVLYNLNGSTTITASSNLAIRQWNHCAAVISAGTARLYLNGALVSTPTAISAASTASVTTYVVGASNSVYLNGYISNLRVLNGTAVYTTPFVPSWAPLTPVANTVLLTAQTNISSNTKVIVDESSNNSIVLGNGNVNSGSFSPFGSTWSVYFDGTGDYLSGSSSQLNFGANDFSIEFWMWPVNTSTNSQIIFQAGSGNLAILLMTGGIIEPGQYQTAAISDSTAVITAGAWHHVVVTRTGTSYRTFINGILRGYGARSFSPNNSSYTIGGASAGTAYTGYISNFKVIANSIPALYTTSSTTVGTTIFTTPTVPFVSEANTVLLTCNSNRFVDYSAANNVITRTGDAAVSRFSPFSPVPVTPASYSGYFDGSGDYLTVTSNTAFGLSTGDFTIESWIYPTAWTNNEGTIIDFRVSGGASSQVKPRIYLTGGTLAYYVSGASRISTTLSSLNVWYHVSVVRLSGSTKLYVNGLQAGSTYTDANDYGSTAQDCVIGQVGDSRAFATGYFTGYISNLRVVKGTAVYTGNFTPPTVQLGLSQSSGTNIAALGIPANGNSVYFDGTGDYLSVPSNANLAFGTGDFTVEAWVYWSSIAAPRPIINMQSSGSFNLYWDSGAFNTNSIVVSNRIANQIIYSFVPVIGTWYHIAVSRSGTNLRLFVNGALVSTAASNTTDYAAGISHIGGDTGTSWYHLGYISNLHAVKGTALYTSTFTPSTSPLTTVANTVLLTCQNSTPSNTRIIIDSSNNAFSISSFGDTVISKIVSPFGNTAALLTCQSTTFIDNSNNAFTITRNGDAKPVIQNPFTDTIGSGTSYTANTYGNSMYFDGTTDYLTVPYSSNFNIPASTPFTFECWAYTTSTNIFVMANRNWSFGSTGSTWGFGLNNGTSPFWSIGGTGASTYNMLNAGLPGALGQWNHYAWTRDSSNVCRVYTNGIEASSVTRTDSQAMTSTSGSIFIGVSSNLASAYANGYMSNMRFLLGQCLYASNFVPSNQPLPPTSNTVLLLSSTSGPSVTDALRISNMETTGTARQVANNSPYYDTYSGYFDGTGDYLTFGANQANLGLGTGDFTFEFWFNAATIPTTEIDIYESQTTNSLRVLKRASSAGLSFDPYGGTATLIMADASITTNTWHHVAISRTSGTTSAYYDGTRVVNQADSTNYATPTVNYGVGGRASGANYFNGYISNMRLVKGTGLYSGTTITVPTGPLTAVTNTQLLICNTNSFVDKSTNAFTITKNGDAKISALQPFAANNTSRFSSVYFPAKTDYLAVRPQPSLTTFPGDFTFECWVYPTDTTLTSAWSIWDSRQAGATANPMIFSLTALASPVTGSWRLSYYNGTQYYGTGTVLWNQWTHVAFVRSGTTMTFYVNGVAGGTATISGTQTGNATTAPIYIGSKDNGLANYGTVGYIADLRITNGYARTITVPTAPYDVK